ncbi:hypothetical protein ACGVWS_12545 [Enterobacteriaceae bacterium LUAb1]
MPEKFLRRSPDRQNLYTRIERNNLTIVPVSGGWRTTRLDTRIDNCYSSESLRPDYTAFVLRWL